MLPIAIMLPMQYIFVRPTAAKSMKILTQIRESFAPEISRYGIIVHDIIQRM
jgi:hypothetical protein